MDEAGRDEKRESRIVSSPQINDQKKSLAKAKRKES